VTIFIYIIIIYKLYLYHLRAHLLQVYTYVCMYVWLNGSAVSHYVYVVYILYVCYVYLCTVTRLCCITLCMCCIWCICYVCICMYGCMALLYHTNYVCVVYDAYVMYVYVCTVAWLCCITLHIAVCPNGFPSKSVDELWLAPFSQRNMDRLGSMRWI
jgi:hypothetical protein